jgi:hypothetical protein
VGLAKCHATLGCIWSAAKGDKAAGLKWIDHDVSTAGGNSVLAGQHGTVVYETIFMVFEPLSKILEVQNSLGCSCLSRQPRLPSLRVQVVLTYLMCIVPGKMPTACPACQ